MNQNTCNTCAHYLQHCAFNQRKLFRVYCGHCTYKTAKTKPPDAKICENYTQAAPDKNAFVTREYLSKALLVYILKLELLPEIHENGRK